MKDLHLDFVTNDKGELVLTCEIILSFFQLQLNINNDNFLDGRVQFLVEEIIRASKGKPPNKEI